jgi:hypothetical protein
MYINNINSTINNNYGSFQDLNLFFKINMGMRKNFSKFLDKLGTRPQKGSPTLSEVEEGLPTAYSYSHRNLSTR